MIYYILITIIKFIDRSRIQYSLCILQFISICDSNIDYFAHDFEIVVSPKGPPSVPTSWLGLEATDFQGRAWYWYPRLFSRNKWPKKSKMRSKHQNLDLSSLIDR